MDRGLVLRSIVSIVGAIVIIVLGARSLFRADELYRKRFEELARFPLLFELTPFSKPQWASQARLSGKVSGVLAIILGTLILIFTSFTLLG